MKDLPEGLSYGGFEDFHRNLLKPAMNVKSRLTRLSVDLCAWTNVGWAGRLLRRLLLRQAVNRPEAQNEINTMDAHDGTVGDELVSVKVGHRLGGGSVSGSWLSTYSVLNRKSA